jgi:hypothetical protein
MSMNEKMLQYPQTPSVRLILIRRIGRRRW